MERNSQLSIHTEDRANRIFDILDVGVREREVKDDFQEFQPEQLGEQRCHFQREEPLVGQGPSLYWGQAGVAQWLSVNL